MQVPRLMAALFGMAACAAAMASAVAEVFYDGYPYYWGNTNCRATANCTVTGGQTQGFVGEGEAPHCL